MDAEELVERLEALRDQPPSAYTPRSESDQVRLARLMGYDLRDLPPARRWAILNQFPTGVTSPVGFAPNYGYRPPEDNNGRGGTPARAPRNPSGPTPVVPGIGEITEVGGRQESAGGVATETRRRPSRRSGRPANTAPAKTRKNRGRHAFLRKGEARGKY